PRELSPPSLHDALPILAVPEAGLEHEVPQVRRRLPREEPEQGALPRAVRADEGDLVPGVEEEVRVLEDERGAPGLPEVPARDDRDRKSTRLNSSHGSSS